MEREQSDSSRSMCVQHNRRYVQSVLLQTAVKRFMCILHLICFVNMLKECSGMRINIIIYVRR